MYLSPSPETLLKWYGVFFIHQGTYVDREHISPWKGKQLELMRVTLTGPYAGSVLRFSVTFPNSYPRNPPLIRFDSDVFHGESCMTIVESCLSRITLVAQLSVSVHL